MHGTPCFAGTRVPVQTLLDYIEDSDTLESFLNDFVTVNRDQAVLFIELAKRVSEETPGRAVLQASLHTSTRQPHRCRTTARHR